MNVPRTIASVLASPLRLATLHELGTVYGVEDLFDFLEIMTVDAFNQRLANKVD